MSEPHRRDVPRLTTSGERLTDEEVRIWLHTPLVGGQRKHLNMFLDCHACRHIRWERTLYFRRANWWFWIRKGVILFRASWWEVLHPRCEQCKFNEKIGRDVT